MIIVIVISDYYFYHYFTMYVYCLGLSLLIGLIFIIIAQLFLLPSISAAVGMSVCCLGGPLGPSCGSVCLRLLLFLDY